MKAEYFKAICQMAVHGAQNLPGETAASVPELYPSYEWLVQNNVTVKKVQIIFRYGDKLYRTVKNNTKFDGKNIPGEDGGKYFTVVQSSATEVPNQEAGINKDDPIEISNEQLISGYTYKYGYFYKYNGIIYQCLGKNGNGKSGEEYILMENPENSKYFKVAW